MGKNRAVALKKGGKTKKSLLNPLIKELYRITADVSKSTSIEDICKQGDLIASKEASFIPPSYNLDRVEVANQLISHLKEQEGTICNVKAVETDSGVGLVAESDADNESELIKLPLPQCISTIDGQDQNPVMNMFKTDPIVSNMMNVQLALNLLFEVFEGENSKYYHYLRTLPAQPKTILSMPVEELLPLKGSSLWMEIEPMIIAIHRQYARVHQLIHGAGPNFDKLKAGFTLSAYKWAVQIIQTRQNGYPGVNNMELNDLFLIPIVDLCNHDTTSTVRLSPSGSENDISICLKAKADGIKEGDSLHLTYSPTTTGEFFIHSGFIPENIESDASKIRITLPKENADWRWALMSQLPIKSPFKVGRETIPHSLINFIRIFLMNEETAKAKFEDMKTAQKIDLTLGDEEPKVFQFLLGRLRLMLMSLEKSISNCDESLLAHKLLSNEQQNYQDAVDYILQLQS